jgi:hypothetical protein
VATGASLVVEDNGVGPQRFYRVVAR